MFRNKWYYFNQLTFLATSTVPNNARKTQTHTRFLHLHVIFKTSIVGNERRMDLLKKIQESNTGTVHLSFLVLCYNFFSFIGFPSKKTHHIYHHQNFLLLTKTRTLKTCYFLCLVFFGCKHHLQMEFVSKYVCFFFSTRAFYTNLYKNDVHTFDKMLWYAFLRV